ncbi:hypothetical protein ACFYWN_43340 [Streptomyces sp. NPDC002917]|uniref:hypothetical protein n=1 Tax=Streptomyces sp. NPDC002917 TaxID=3364671 RepID=UPI0036BAA2AA
MALPGTVRALRILLYVHNGFVAIAVVGIALQYYPGSVFVQVLSLLPAVATGVHVFYLQSGRGVLRITLTVTLSVDIVGAFYLMVMEGSPGAVIGVALGTAMLVLLHQRSSREWFAHSASKTVNPPQSALG